MSTLFSSNDFDAFYAFLGELRSHALEPISPEESLQRFRESQARLRQFQQLNEVAIAQSQSGLSKPLDLQAVLERVEQRVRNFKQAQ
jgi:hypothetical protein